MGVFRDVTIEWKGQTYTVTPSNRLLRKIEGEGISLTHMIYRVGNGKPPVSEVAFVTAELLKSAGAEVHEDEVYEEIMTAMGSGDNEAVTNLAVSIIQAISPTALDEKKPKAPAGK